MLRLSGRIPRELAVACSGGVDSMAALDFLRRSRRVTAVFVDHGTEASRQGAAVVSAYCHEHEIPMWVYRIDNSQKPRDSSWEEFWRDQRYQEFLRLDTWIWTSCHGHPRVIPWRRGTVIRPFLQCTKQALESWCQRKGVEWTEDPSNQDVSYTRNLIRREVMPQILRVNPGIGRVVLRRVQDNLRKELDTADQSC
jgi:tRNA(Ile)-lysidine synthase